MKIHIYLITYVLKKFVDVYSTYNSFQNIIAMAVNI